MRYAAIPSEMFIENRRRLAAMLPSNALALVNANDLCPTNADGLQNTVVNSDLFYLTGVEQEQTILLLYPEADEPKNREILFLREPTPENELWEGHKLSKDEARERTGIANIQWLSGFSRLLHTLICESGPVFLNANEHKRAVIEVESREARFAADLMRRYPIHDYQRLAPFLHRLRAVKSEIELGFLRRACDLTGTAFERVLRFTKPGVLEYEVEAEFAHEFISHGGRFAYPPIIASGKNACCLHYVSNDQPCRDGELLLLDVAGTHANYNADMTRTIPVNGRFTRRQKQVYNGVLRALRHSIAGLVPGKKTKDWQKEAELAVQHELLELGLLKPSDIKRQKPDALAVKKYFMHGVGHPLGLDVHDVAITTEPMRAGWVMTVEPGIYIPEEGFAVRLENDVLLTDKGPVDLMGHIPIEAEEIEDLMNQGTKSAKSGKRLAAR
jgi:Xaa-Pro aminopeptidase